MANIKELIQSIESGDSSFDEKLAAINQMEETLVAMKEHEQEAIDDNVELIIEALRTIEAKVEAKLRIVPEKGEQGIQGAKGEQGDRGLDGAQGKDGKSGADGKDGLDGKDGVSVQDAKIDFDGSLVITLSDGKEINVGEVVPVDVAEKIRTVHNIQSGSGGDSQTVLDAIAALQATIATYGTMATQNANAVAITGGTIDNTTIGATTPSTGVFTTLTAQNETLKGTGQNLILRSQALTTAPWSLNVSPTTGSTTDPLGGSTATQFTTSSTNSGVFQFPTVGNGFTLTWSVYIRYISGDGTVKLGVEANPSNATLVFNSSAGTITSTGAGLTASSVTNAGSGWYRVSGTFVSTGTTVGIVIYSNNSNASSFGAWGAQLEIGSTANTYVPTTTTAVYGTPTLSFSGVASLGLQSDGSLYETSAGTGNVRFYTNNIAQEQMRVSHTASAVNYHQLTGSATGSGPIHSVAGSDTNIDNNLSSKGSGVLNLNTGAGTQVRIIDSGGTAVNRIHLQGQGTGFLPVIASRGSDTNLGMSYSTQGTGGHDFYTAGTNFTQQVKIAHTASAVNYVQVTGATTGNSPALTLQGSDANVAGVISTKGTGGFSFYTNNVNQRQLRIIHTASSVNFFDVTGGATGFGPVLSAQGSDTNIPLVLQPKGTGALQAQQTDSTATGGNARGANAVDWQTIRSGASQVAAGQYGVVSGGISNTVNSVGGVVGGGSGNFVSSSGYVGGVFSGQSNQSNGFYSPVVGGASNQANGYYNFIGAGFTNTGTASAAVTTQSATMNGTTAVTLSGSNASIKVGQIISGTSIAGDTYVAAISGTSLTLSKVASGSSTSTLSFYTPHGVVVGGGNNQATGSYSFIGGGGDAGTAANRNVASGDWSVVVGGRKNTASGQSAFVGAGGDLVGSVFGNTASGVTSAVVGGFNNTASGYGGFVGGGSSNVASATYSALLGGNSNSTNSDYSSIVGGAQGTTRSIIGNNAQPYCNNPLSSPQGASQGSALVLAVQTTDATATVLRSNTSAAGTTNQVILPNNSAYYFKGSVIANVTGGGNTKAWAIEGAIKRGANAASTALVGTPTVTSGYADAGASTWDITATADTTNGGLKITFTGQASTTIRCVAKLETTEVTF